MTTATPTPYLFLAQTPAAPPAAAPTTATTAAPGTAPSTQPAPGLLQSPAVPLVFMAVIFYFLLIRPQQKRAKDQAALVNSLKSGDRVLTNSGIYGMITNVSPEDKIVTVKIAEGVKVDMSRDSVTTVLKSAAGGDAKAAPGQAIAAKPVR